MLQSLPGAMTAALALRGIIAKERPSSVIVNDLYAAIPLQLAYLLGPKPPWWLWVHACDFPQNTATRRLVTGSQGAICVSEAVRRSLTAWTDLPQVVIRNAIETRTLSVPDRAWRCAAGLNEHWVVAFCGRLDANKNLAGLLRAWAMIRLQLEASGPASLVCIGDGPDLTSLKNLAHALGLDDCVHWLGWHEHPSSILGACDALVLPSHLEAMGLVILEAQLLGLPVLGTAVGGIPELINDGRSGLLARSPSPEHLAEGLLRLRQSAVEPLVQGGRRSAQCLADPAVFTAAVRQLFGLA